MKPVFHTIQWFNTKSKIWIYDYHYHVNDKDGIIISLQSNKEKYRFIMTKKLSEDIYVILERVINDCIINDISTTFKIINLGCYCNDQYVHGNFEIRAIK